ncbi:hypothetical protein [uncultured Sulfitobacter sp.]|uniref:hypothetical protein n=1 Tax=uncultured Sulfitobacter sp. TaxID=191468 RepID=UPI00260A7C55|nr:hypothetical protein [uncultured Sulfitobacter sp.]
MISISAWNAIEKFIAELILEDGRSIGMAIGEAVRRYPEVSSSDLILASISVCSSVDQFDGVTTYENLLSSQIRYETIAALAADIAALPPNKRACSCLLKHWIDTEDGIFSL